MKNNLIDDIHLNLKPSHIKRLSAIVEEDYSPIKWKIKEMNPSFSDSYIDRGIFALQQYYALPILDPANAHAVSAQVDPFWHTHMLFSKQYASFCDKIVETFLHHAPLDKSDSEQVKEAERLYGYTLKTLPRIFSTLDKQFWPENNSKDNLICIHYQTPLNYDVHKDKLFDEVKEGQMEVIR